LKGDSAACGFHKLMNLPRARRRTHPAGGGARGDELAELVLAAADSFGAMLAAIRGMWSRPPSKRFMP